MSLSYPSPSPPRSLSGNVQTVHFYQHCATQQNMTVMQISIPPALKLLHNFRIHSNLPLYNITLEKLNMSTISNNNDNNILGELNVSTTSSQSVATIRQLSVCINLYVYIRLFSCNSNSISRIHCTYLLISLAITS